MRSRRATLIFLGLLLSLILAACSKKTEQSADNAAPAQTQPTPAQPAPAAPAPPPPIVVPSGTALTVRLAQSVGSKISQAGQSFSGSVADAVVIGGSTAIPAGTLNHQYHGATDSLTKSENTLNAAFTRIVKGL